MIHFTHSTIYSYSGPVIFHPHRLVVRPRDSYHQRLKDITITCNLAHSIRWTEDIFGNMIAKLTFQQQGSMLEIVSDFTVWCSPPPEDLRGPEGILVPMPPYYQGIEQAATYLYCQSVYPPELDYLRNWVFGLNILGPAGQKAPIFDRLADKIKELIGYKRREESGVQTPKETLRLGTGSCRDTAVLMLETARSLGYAARFVSGYLESENSRVGRGATHAWCEIYLPERGWTGYDPSIGEPVSLGHVRVGVSHHPRGVMPVSGSFNRQGNVSQGMTVGITSERVEAQGATS